jgi:hypothetical protein
MKINVRGAKDCTSLYPSENTIQKMLRSLLSLTYFKGSILISALLSLKPLLLLTGTYIYVTPQLLCCLLHLRAEQ